MVGAGWRSFVRTHSEEYQRVKYSRVYHNIKWTDEGHVQAFAISEDHALFNIDFLDLTERGRNIYDAIRQSRAIQDKYVDHIEDLICLRLKGEKERLER